MKMLEQVPAYEGKEPYLFVSYAHKNSDLVQPVLRILFENKIRVWYDEGIAPGSEWPHNIAWHLQHAAGVLVFVSPASLMSPNCENEVVNAVELGCPVFQYPIEDARHPLLKDRIPVNSPEDLLVRLEVLPLLGDGTTGYSHGVGKIRKGNFWSGILALAVMLLVALGAGIYGLNAGWFDSLLPGLAQAETAAANAAQPEIIKTEKNALTKGVVNQTRQELLQPISFRSDETKALLEDAIGFEIWGQSSPINYQNLIDCPIEEIRLDAANDELLEYMQYFPSLTRIDIRSGELETLQPLLSCANLQLVRLTYGVFPVTIPENASFTVEYFNG